MESPQANQGLIPIQLEVVVDPAAPPVQHDTVSFETGSNRSQVRDPEGHAYNHHGLEFSSSDPGALTSFYQDLILGRPMPVRFVTHRVEDLDVWLALALFGSRDLVMSPKMVGLVASVDLVHRYGPSLFGHLDPDLTQFLLYVLSRLQPGLSKAETGRRITETIQKLRDYVLTNTPVTVPKSNRPKEVLIRHYGTSGFVVAETDGLWTDGWITLYRSGYLRGFLWHPGGVTIARKSLHCSLDLNQAAYMLGEIEGKPWQPDPSGLWLHGPSHGKTDLTENVILEVLLRV